MAFPDTTILFTNSGLADVRRVSSGNRRGSGRFHLVCHANSSAPAWVMRAGIEAQAVELGKHTYRWSLIARVAGVIRAMKKTVDSVLAFHMSVVSAAFS